MATTQPPAQQQPPASHPPQNQSQPSSSSSAAQSSAQTAPDQQQSTLPFPAIPQDQVVAILKTLGGRNFYQAGRPMDPKNPTEAAEALQNMSQSGFPHNLPPYQHYQPLPGSSAGGMQSPQNGGNDDGSQDGDDSPGPSGSPDNDKPKSSGGRRSGRSATMTNDEWIRQRKDNHKEVERRRRGNINEGINELGRIVPNGSGEKAKGAILSRAVQYIHHLKENEARNIEKWTLEKLLMDQAMGDLQAQLEEMRRLWEDERVARQRLETELAALKTAHGQSPAQGPTRSNGSPAGSHGGDDKPSPKRTLDEARGTPPEGNAHDSEERVKRQRVE